jgi:4-hydroxybenzoate polyprenyltransferase
MPAAAVDLIRAAHPLPSAAVTALTTALAISTGTGLGRTAVVAAAVLTGQLSVGLHNDLVDRQRDAAVGRTDKPLATGAVPVGAARAVLLVSLLACVVLSFSLGPAPAAAHLSAVAVAGAYNAGLKGTWLSWAPYALAFALLPVTVWLVSPIEALPPWWLILATALLGTGAHAANVLPDLADDRATGLPHRLPERILRVTTAVLLLAGLVLVTVAPRGAAAWEPLAIGGGAALAVSAGVPWAGRRWPLLAAIGIGTLAAAIMVARGAAA